MFTEVGENFRQGVVLLSGTTSKSFARSTVIRLLMVSPCRLSGYETAELVRVDMLFSLVLALGFDGAPPGSLAWSAFRHGFLVIGSEASHANQQAPSVSLLERAKIPL